jgi:hypothetical protein
MRPRHDVQRQLSADVIPRLATARQETCFSRCVMRPGCCDGSGELASRFHVRIPKRVALIEPTGAAMTL